MYVSAIIMSEFLLKSRIFPVIRAFNRDCIRIFTSFTLSEKSSQYSLFFLIVII